VKGAFRTTQASIRRALYLLTGSAAEGGTSGSDTSLAGNEIGPPPAVSCGDRSRRDITPWKIHPLWSLIGCMPVFSLLRALGPPRRTRRKGRQLPGAFVHAEAAYGFSGWFGPTSIERGGFIGSHRDGAQSEPVRLVIAWSR
jgi:hypothetical protein